MVSQKLKDAVKTSEKLGFRIAQEADMHPSMMSQLLNDILNVKDGDQRVIRIGKVVGVDAEECFE